MLHWLHNLVRRPSWVLTANFEQFRKLLKNYGCTDVAVFLQVNLRSTGDLYIGLIYLATSSSKASVIWEEGELITFDQMIADGAKQRRRRQYWLGLAQRRLECLQRDNGYKLRVAITNADGSSLTRLELERASQEQVRSHGAELALKYFFGQSWAA